jgi:uncharacterized membrane-anchored protein YitT (DUF2179 family)
MVDRFRFFYTPAWNILLVVTGSVLMGFGLKAIAYSSGFMQGGVFGVAFLGYYYTGLLSPGLIYFLLNVPLFLFGWAHVSRRFFLYSLLSMGVTTLTFELVTFEADIAHQIYAAVAGGVVIGAGWGIVLRSLGSSGGLDIIAILLNQKYNIGIGKFYFAFNALLFSWGFFQLGTDLVIASLIMTFIISVVGEYVISMFSQRKTVLIVSDKAQAILDTMLKKFNFGATVLKARGAYSGKEKEVVLCVINNIQLKRLEQLVFTIDPAALFIVEETFSVIGSSFAKRKIY